MHQSRSNILRIMPTKLHFVMRATHTALLVLGFAAQPAKSQTLLVESQGLSSPCQNVPRPKPTACGVPVCIARDLSYEIVPRPAGWRCNTTGRCDGIHEDCIVPSSGSIYPAYVVSSVLYMPPGPSSFVSYGLGSTLGTSMSTTNSWKNSRKVEAALGTPKAGASATTTFGMDWSGSNKSQVDLKYSISQDMKANAAPSDKVNHNYDQILLLLGPRIDLHVFPNNVIWTPDVSEAVPQVVLVGWLNGSIPMPDSVKATLAQYNISSKDYSEMLKTDPFGNDADGTIKPDPVRFVLKTRIPYQPILASYSYQMDNNYSSTSTISSEVSYSVGLSASTDAILTSLKAGNTFTWSSSSSQSNSQSTSNTSKLMLTMPSNNYSGPTALCVYIDTIYKTFLFSFVSPSGAPCTKQ